MRVNGASRFFAYLTPKDRSPQDVHWTLQLQYAAAGAIWRRVPLWKRPELWVEVSSFKLPGPGWRDIERFDAWSLPEDDDDYWNGPGGFLDVTYYPRAGVEGAADTFANDHIWRVAGRDGRWFTVELAAFADGRSILREKPGLPEPVHAGGAGDAAREERAADEEFWRKHSELYVVEQVPFGTALVVVPRNVRDPEAYAIGRARELIGGGTPEHVDVHDHRDSERESVRNDLHVTLHYHGYYED